MAKYLKTKHSDNGIGLRPYLVAGPGGATHQIAESGEVSADMARCGAPSVFFDAVAIFASAEGIKQLLKNSAAIDWVRDALGHLKVIGHTSAAQLLLDKAALADDLHEGVIDLDTRPGVRHYIKTAKQQLVWAREARLADVNA
jgi:catalase